MLNILQTWGRSSNGGFRGPDVCGAGGSEDAGKSRREELGCSVQPVSHRHTLGTIVGVVAVLRICYHTPRQAISEMVEQERGFLQTMGVLS